MGFMLLFGYVSEQRKLYTFFLDEGGGDGVYSLEISPVGFVKMLEVERF